MKTRAILLSALLFLVTPFLFPSMAEPVEPNPERLREAQVIALDLDGQSLCPPVELAERIYEDLAAVRVAYPFVADITYRPSAVPDEIIIALTEGAYEQYQQGQYHALDGLNAEYGMIEMRQFIPNKPNFVLTFNQVYNTQMLADIYAPAEGVVYAQPNYYYGDGSTIEAGPPFYTFVRKWGDCPSGCIHQESWRFKVEDGQVTLLRDGHWPPSGVEIIPENPTSSDVIEITLSGDWPDNCTPTGSAVLVSGRNVYFDVISNTALMRPCALVVTPWWQSQSVGPLAAGTYSLYARHVEAPIWTEPYPPPVPDQSLYTLLTQFSVTSTGESTRYAFDADQSTVTQTGGFAGVHETYDVAGDFELTVNRDAGTARFSRVDALIGPGSFLPTQSLDELFNMTQLDGSMVTNTQIHFTGKTQEGLVDVSIWVVLIDDAAYLTGQTNPPCCDFFNYAINAVALKGARVRYVDADAPGNNDGSSWADAYNYLQDALVTAVSGDEIRVAQGVYKPDQGGGNTPGDREATFRLKNNVVIMGGYMGYGTHNPDSRDDLLSVSILSGDLAGNDVDVTAPGELETEWTRWENSFHVVTGSNTDQSAVLDGFTITGGYADSKGGGMYNESSRATIVNCIFTKNAANDGMGLGGGMFNLNSSPTITDCTFRGNYAREAGGGLYNDQSDPVITNCSFRGNVAGETAGGMYNDDETGCELTNCTFSDNSATYGGGMYNRQSTGTLTGCTLNGNSSVIVGGGMFNSWSSVTAVDCTFTGNVAQDEDEDFEGGGAMCSAHSDVTLTGCILTSNSAHEGGALANYDGTGTATNCTFYKNSAGSGGAILGYRSGSLILTGCIFTGNSAHEGGAIYTYENSSTIANCILLGNSAESNGGAIYLENDSSSLVNCLFSGNSAKSGGAIWCEDENEIITNCTFSNNSAVRDGGALCMDERFKLTNCILWGNSAAGEVSQPAQVHVCNPRDVVINHNCIQGWTGSLGGAGNHGVDPLFIDADGADEIFGTEDDDLRLSTGSPCIDAGDPDYVSSPRQTDLAGKPRVAGGRVDMGAYEFGWILYVDADNGDDGNDGLTPETAFATIQKGIDSAEDGWTVQVMPGRYLQLGPGAAEDNVAFSGRNIRLTSADPADPDIVRSTVIQGPVIFHGTEGPSCVLTGFTISDMTDGGIHGVGTHATICRCVITGNAPCNATVIKDCHGIISNCVIADNSGFTCSLVNPVVFGCHGVIRNCTIVNNHSGVGVLEGGTTTIENCIIYNNFSPQIGVRNGGTVNVCYSDLQAGPAGIENGGNVNWGPGNIDAEPRFVRWGEWEDGLTELAEGDYHLMSEGWRWDVGRQVWTWDNVTSRCIDAGNPGFKLGDEALCVPDDPDNKYAINLRINMGAYGGTGQASLAPHGWAILGDLTNDGVVNILDYAVQARQWLGWDGRQPGDLNRDGSISGFDLGLLVEDWLKTTTWRQ